MEARIGSRLLETLTSALYSDPIVLFREYVQNSVDRYLSMKNDGVVQKDFFVDIKILLSEKCVKIHDNGYAISVTEFVNKMTTIGDSDKGKEPDLIGFKGIGRLSGMPFCNKLKFRNKCIGSTKVQVFEWSNDDYLRLLESKDDAGLQESLHMITKSSEESDDYDSQEHFFEVVLIDIKDELLEQISTTKKISERFKKDLISILPLPYAKEFSYKDIIAEHYKDFFGSELNKYEFDIRLNNDKLYKPYVNEDIKSDIYFVPCKFKPELGAKQEKFGLLWFSCDYLFKAYKNEFGISVRSKNILLSDKSIFADEAYRSAMRPTTHGQLIAGLKGIKGELLIYSDDLSDNSKRDWFRYDKYALFLREVIVEFMKNLHNYRYKASIYFNNEQKESQMKADLISTFEKFVAFDTTNIESFIGNFDIARPIDFTSNEDVVASIGDIKYGDDEYRQAYVDIMNFLYEEMGEKKNDYYKIKAKIIKTLNQKAKDE